MKKNAKRNASPSNLCSVSSRILLCRTRTSPIWNLQVLKLPALNRGRWYICDAAIDFHSCVLKTGQRVNSRRGIEPSKKKKKKREMQQAIKVDDVCLSALHDAGIIAVWCSS